MQTTEKERKFIEWVLDQHCFVKEEEGVTYLNLPLVIAGLKNEFADFVSLPDVAQEMKRLNIGSSKAKALSLEAYNLIRKTV